MLGNISMVNAMLGYGMNHSFTSLMPEVIGGSPNGSGSVIPYEKGH